MEGVFWTHLCLVNVMRKIFRTSFCTGELCNICKSSTNELAICRFGLPKGARNYYVHYFIQIAPQEEHCGIQFKYERTLKREDIGNFIDNIQRISCDEVTKMLQSESEFTPDHVNIANMALGGTVILLVLTNTICCVYYLCQVRGKKKTNVTQTQQSIEMTPKEDNFYDELYYVDGRQLDQAIKGRTRYSAFYKHIHKVLNPLKSSSRRGGSIKGGQQDALGTQVHPTRSDRKLCLWIFHNLL